MYPTNNDWLTPMEQLENVLKGDFLVMRRRHTINLMEIEGYYGEPRYGQGVFDSYVEAVNHESLARGFRRNDSNG